VFVPVNEVVPVPLWVTDPAPETTPPTVSPVSVRLKESEVPDASETLPVPIEPVVPPAPIWMPPASTWMPPAPLPAPFTVRTPVPFFTIRPVSVSAPSKRLPLKVWVSTTVVELTVTERPLLSVMLSAPKSRPVPALLLVTSRNKSFEALPRAPSLVNSRPPRFMKKRLIVKVFAELVNTKRPTPAEVLLSSRRSAEALPPEITPESVVTRPPAVPVSQVAALLVVSAMLFDRVPVAPKKNAVIAEVFPSVIAPLPRPLYTPPVRVLNSTAPVVCDEAGPPVIETEEKLFAPPVRISRPTPVFVKAPPAGPEVLLSVVLPVLEISSVAGAVTPAPIVTVFAAVPPITRSSAPV